MSTEPKKKKSKIKRIFAWQAKSWWYFSLKCVGKEDRRPETGVKFLLKEMILPPGLIAFFTTELKEEITELH